MIAINAIIEQRVDTTANWTSVNPIVSSLQAAWEYQNDGVTPVGVKLGNGTSHWNDLPYWFLSNGYSSVILTKTAGVAMPVTLSSFQTLYSAFGRFPNFKFVKIIDNGDYTFSYQYLNANSIITKEITTGKPDSITLDVDDDGTGHVQDNILIIISN